MARGTARDQRDVAVNKVIASVKAPQRYKVLANALWEGYRYECRNAGLPDPQLQDAWTTYDGVVLEYSLGDLEGLTAWVGENSAAMGAHRAYWVPGDPYDCVDAMQRVCRAMIDELRQRGLTCT